MTWFTRMALNPQRRGARKLLANPQAMHAAVMSAFPPGALEQAADQGRPLWRLDSHHPEHTLYVVSPAEPDLQHVVEQAGWSTASWETTPYTRFLDQLRKGQEWRFRLRANPVKALPSGSDRRGKVVPHVTPAQQVRWLESRAPGLGFELVSASSEEGSEPLTSVTGRADRAFNRFSPEGERTRVTLRQAQFDGVLTVADAEKLRHAMVHGIGRGKAYGCGLLTLRRI